MQPMTVVLRNHWRLGVSLSGSRLLLSRGVVSLFHSSPFVIRLMQLTDHWLSIQFGAANWINNQWPVGFLWRMTNGDKWGRMKKRNNTSTSISHAIWPCFTSDFRNHFLNFVDELNQISRCSFYSAHLIISCIPATPSCWWDGLRTTVALRHKRESGVNKHLNSNHKIWKFRASGWLQPSSAYF